jgi:tetratricopeptide (TPR) repeat protein
MRQLAVGSWQLAVGSWRRDCQLPTANFRPTFAVFRCASHVLLVHLSLVLLYLLTACSQAGPPPAPTTVLEGYNAAVATAEAKNDMRSLAIIYYERGNYHFDQGDYEAAVADYSQVTKLDPTDARAYNNQGLAYAALGETDQALAAYDAAISRDAAYTRAYKNRLTLLEGQGKLQQIAADYDRLSILEPRQAGEYRYRQGSALRGLGDVQGSRDAFTAALAADPKQPDALYELGVLNFADGKLPEALDNLDRAIQISPRAANARYVRGMIRNATGDIDGAIADFSAALDLQPNDPATLLARAAAYLARNDRDNARSDLARAKALPLDTTLTAVADALERGVNR